jgi:hypothetical protein
MAQAFLHSLYRREEQFEQVSEPTNTTCLIGAMTG